MDDELDDRTGNEGEPAGDELGGGILDDKLGDETTFEEEATELIEGILLEETEMEDDEDRDGGDVVKEEAIDEGDSDCDERE